jgi:hypothetical protein
MSCARCSHRSVTGDYKARSHVPITEKAMKQLNIKTESAKGMQISTCNKCTSPDSRIVLHNENVFKRYEYQFLNLLLSGTPEKRGYTIHLNELNPTKTRFDAFIENNNELHKKYAINIEVDEKQHYLNKTQFKKDRVKELRDLKERRDKGYKVYLLRIRVGENAETSCVSKTGKSCVVHNKDQFNKNLKIAQEHIRQALNGKKVVEKAYIDFSKQDGITEYPFSKFEDISKKTNALKAKIQKKRKKRVNVS